MRKLSLIFIIITFIFSCAKSTKNHSPEEVYPQTLKSLNEAETFYFDAQIVFGNQRVVNHTYKIQKGRI